MKSEKTSYYILDDLKKSLKKEFGENIESIVLFGSRAKENATENSDYDIVIVLNNDYDWNYEKQISKIVYKFELDKNIFTDVHLISLNQLNNTIKGKDPLFYNALKSGIYL
jgi:predicted nucleotidyltransferase